MPTFFLVLSTLFFISCSGVNKSSNDAEKTEKQTVHISSVKELKQLLDDLNYTSASLRSGNAEVPRLYFSKIGDDWKNTADTISVHDKKSIFFRLLTPLVLMSNEEIQKEREQLQKAAKESPFVKKLALKYKVLKNSDTEVDEALFAELKKRVDIIPVSLALAQGAEESGWATSRFSSKGNALFGQWDFSGKGMQPKDQRRGLGNYGLARFETPLDSVKAYMLNLNTGFAYERLRTLRQQLRKENKQVTGWELAKTLDRYSERGQAYIDGLHEMIRFNKLQSTNTTYLADGPEIHLRRKTQN